MRIKFKEDDSEDRCLVDPPENWSKPYDKIFSIGSWYLGKEGCAISISRDRHNKEHLNLYANGKEIERILT